SCRRSRAAPVVARIVHAVAPSVPKGGVHGADQVAFEVHVEVPHHEPTQPPVQDVLTLGGEHVGVVVGPPLVAVVDPVRPGLVVEESSTFAFFQVGEGHGGSVVVVFDRPLGGLSASFFVVLHTLPATAECGDTHDEFVGGGPHVEVALHSGVDTVGVRVEVGNVEVGVVSGGFVPGACEVVALDRGEVHHVEDFAVVAPCLRGTARQ